MSVRTDVINLQVNVNGNAAQNNLNELRKKAKDIAFEMDGLKKNTQAYIDKKNQLKEVTAEMDALKKTIGITALSQKELTAELNKLKALRGSTVPFSKEFKDFSEQIKKVEDRLYDVRNGVQGFASFFSKIKDQVKQFGVFAAGYLGFQFISTQFTNIINGAGKLSDQLADLRRVSGLTAEEANNLNSALSKLDTRTAVGSLRDIAIIAGKLGVAKEDILGFTAATDKLVVALGDELGNADQITTQLGKILNVFEGEITGDNITKLGNAIVDLANKGVASGSFIVDFTQRLAGLSNVANISLDAAVGLAAGLEEMGLKSESSTTAVIKVLGDIAKDTDKFAKVAGKSVEEFSKTLRDKPIEALLQVSEGFSKNKSGFQEISAAFSEAGADGARVISTLGTLGGKADFFRQKIAETGVALQNTNAINEAFALKNETLGATLDKLGKEFNRLMTSSAVVNFLKGAVEGALSFIQALKNIPEFLASNKVALLTLLAGVLIYNKAMITSALVTIRDTLAKTANAIANRTMAAATAIAQVAQASYITVTTLLTGRITLATAAQRLWNIAMSLGAGPIGILIAVGGALALLIGNLITKQNAFNAAARAANNVAKEASQIYGDQVNTLERLKKILTDENAGLALKKEAYKQLIAIHPEFAKTLSLDASGHLQGVDAINQYIAALKDKSEVQAAETLSNKAYTEILQKQQELTEVDTKFFIQGRTHERRKLTKEIQELVKEKEFYDGLIRKKLETKVTSAPATGGRGGGGQVSSGSNVNQAANIASETIATIKAKLKDIDDAYETIDISNKKALSSNRAAAKALQDQLNALEGKKSPSEKKEDNKLDQLRKEADAFAKEIKKLQQEAQRGTLTESQREIQAIEHKYRDLTTRALKYWKENTDIGKQKLGEIKSIRDLQLEALFKKQFAANSEKEYEESLKALDNFFDEERNRRGQEYATGKIGKKEYEAALVDIESRETQNRIIVAKDYAENSKKAASDVTTFTKKELDQQTKDAIKAAEDKKAATMQDKLAGARLKVLTSPKGSDDRLKAQKELLELQFQYDTEYLDKKSNLYLEKERELQDQIKELDTIALQEKIDRYVQYIGYFQKALDGLNTIITNKENRELAKDKARNDAKRAQFKKQLDGKLLSQAQYDKKMNVLQEEQDKKEREMKRKQAKREKALNIFRAIVNVAAGVASSLSSGGPVGIALAAITAILGAIEIAAIASAPLPELGKGGWIKTGDKHSDPSGGINAKIERDEAVMSAAAMRNSKRFTVSGNTAQITSLLNGISGGAMWSSGARINPALPGILAGGGFNGITPAGTDNNNEMIELMKILIARTDKTTEAVEKIPTTLHAEVSLSDLERKKRLLEESKQASAFAQ